jgi:hypothetical protein
MIAPAVNTLGLLGAINNPPLLLIREISSLSSPAFLAFGLYQHSIVTLSSYF